MGKVHIGTSGWHYKHWVGQFYPEKVPASEMFSFYSRHFDTVEINNSFYRLPEASTFESWRANSPKNFIFSVKASRFITHMKKLKDPKTSTAKFLYAADHLAERLGPILFQLPPRWHLNLERLTQFLNALPTNHKYAFEFRDESWFVAEVYELLRKHNVAFCIHDLGGEQTPLEITADFSFIRFHGPGRAKYSGSYSTETLGEWAMRINKWRRKLSGVFVYFNNDIGGHAVENAKELQFLLNRSIRHSSRKRPEICQ